MARLVRMLPELFVLVKGMIAGLRSIVAIFETVPTAMQFLLSQVLCGYDAAFLGRMLEEGWACYAAWLTFMILASFTIMNMLIGILCTVVSGAYEQAKEDAWQLELEARADRTLEMLNVRKT